MPRFLIAAVQGKGLAEPTAKEFLRSQVKIPDGVNASWGLGVAIEETPQGTRYGHGGRNTGFTSFSGIFKDSGIGYVFLVNNDDASKMDNVLNAYLIAGKSALKNLNPPSHKVAKVDPTLYDAYVGRYQVSPDTIVTFTVESNRLMAQGTGEGKVEIFPESETTFFFKPASDATVTFVKNDKGKVTHIKVHRDGRDTEAKRLAPDPKTTN